MQPFFDYDIDPEIAGILAVVTEALFSGDLCDVDAAFDYVMERDNVAPVIITLGAAEQGLLALFTAVEPDRAACDVSDEVARRVLINLWDSPHRVLMAQASLRSCLDNGTYTSLSPEMYDAYVNDKSGERINVLLMLVTGMAALYAKEHALASVGAPLRLVLRVD